MYKLYVTCVSSCYEECPHRICASVCRHYGWNVCRHGLHGHFPGGCLCLLYRYPVCLGSHCLHDCLHEDYVHLFLPRLSLAPGSTEIRRPSTSKPFIESMTRLASPSSTSKNEKLSRKSIRPIRPCLVRTC